MITQSATDIFRIFKLYKNRLKLTNIPGQTLYCRNLTKHLLGVQVFWDVTPCRLVDNNQCSFEKPMTIDQSTWRHILQEGSPHVLLADLF